MDTTEAIQFGDFQIMTLGTSNRSMSDFCNLLPEREDGNNRKVKLIYASPATTDNPRQRMSFNNVATAMDRRGVECVALPGLSGEVTSKQYIESVNTVLRYAADGYNLIIVSGPNTPDHSNRFLIGQTIEQQSNIHVGHIYTSREGDRVITDQPSLVRSRLSGRFPSSGDHRDVTFTAKGEALFKDGVVAEGLKRHSGRMNPISVNLEFQNRSREELENEMFARADIILSFSTAMDHRQDINARVRARRTAESKLVPVNLMASIDGTGESALEASKLADKDFITATASRISKGIARAVDSHEFTLSGKDRTRLVIGVIGGDISSLSTWPTELVGATIDELNAMPGQAKAVRGYEAGAKNPADAGDLQEAYDAFQFNVFKQVQDTLAQDGIRIAGFSTVFQSGVVEATVKAARDLGYSREHNLTISPQDSPYTQWNGTEMGNSNKDISEKERQVLINNILSTSRRPRLTPDSLERQADVQRQLAATADGQRPCGLTNKQVCVLQQLNLQNDTIARVCELSVTEQVKLAGDESKGVYISEDSFNRFVVACVAAGIEEMNEVSGAMLAEANQKVAQLDEWARFEGVNIFAADSPLYPKALREAMQSHNIQMDKFFIRRSVDDSGVESVHIEVNPYGVQSDNIENRPATLSVKGNAQIANTTPCVSLVGSEAPTELDKEAARRMGRSLSAAGLTLIASLDDELGRAALEAANENDGLCYAVTSKHISEVGKDDGQEDKLSRDIIEKGGAVASTEPAKGAQQPDDEDKRNRQRLLAKTTSGLSSSVMTIIGDIGKDESEAIFSALLLPVGLTVWGAQDAIRAFKVKHPDKVNELTDDSMEKLAELARANIQEQNQTTVSVENTRQEVQQHTIPIIYKAGEKFAFVPPAMSGVIKALKEYDSSLTILEPSMYDEVLHDLTFDTETLFGKKVDTFAGYRGVASVEHPAPVQDSLYFVDGKVFTYDNAPDYTYAFRNKDGHILTAQNRRLLEGYLLNARRQAEQIRNELQQKIGYSGTDALVLPGAITVSCTDRSIRIHDGGDLRAEITLTERGLESRNVSITGDELNDSLGNYQPKGNYNVFGKEGPLRTREDLDKAIEDIRSCVLGIYPRNPQLSEDAALDESQSQDTLAKLQEFARNNNNVDNAAKALAANPQLTAPHAFEQVDDKVAHALIFSHINTLDRQLTEANNKETGILKKLAKAEAYRDSLDRSDSIDFNQMQEAEENLADLREQHAKLLNERNEILLRELTLLKAKDSIVRGQKVMAEGKKVGESKRGEVTLLIDGATFTLPNRSLSQSDTDLAEKNISRRAADLLSPYASRFDFQSEAAEHAILGKRQYKQQENQNSQPQEQQVLSTDFILQEDKNLLVKRVKRDGMYAYMSDGKLTSKFYEQALPQIPMGSSMTFIYKNPEMSDQPNQPIYLFDGRGKEVCPEPVIIGHPTQERISRVMSESGQYNWLKVDNGELLLKEWSREAYDFAQGWGFYKDSAGRYNAISVNGDLLDKEGFEQASKCFNANGVATVKKGGKEYSINTKGMVLSNAGEAVKKQPFSSQAATRSAFHHHR